MEQTQIFKSQNLTSEKVQENKIRAFILNKVQGM